MRKIIAVVGMPGSGKTEATVFLEKRGFIRIRFGDVAVEEVKKLGLDVNEKNERAVRERLRREKGMDAFAKLNLTRISNALKKSNVVIDGLYSWEEYLLLKKKFSNLTVIAMYASPKTRHGRLAKRPERPLTKKECEERDKAQLKKLHTGPPIALADFTFVNECSLDEMKKGMEEILRMIKR